MEALARQLGCAIDCQHSHIAPVSMADQDGAAAPEPQQQEQEAAVEALSSMLTDLQITELLNKPEAE